ncbi:MAG: BrnA antitoxin family protein [Chloroflexota bacterium]|nr:BrnA antitoxin family protein [Chloroflexota bacterium]
MSKIPEFQSIEEEADFWDTHSAVDFFDQTTEVDMRIEVPRPKKVPISLRLDPATVMELKAVARQQGIGYQTLIRMWVMERLTAQSATQVAAVRESAGAYHVQNPTI